MRQLYGATRAASPAFALPKTGKASIVTQAGVLSGPASAWFGAD
jgi:hypothetical protein